MPPPYFVVKLPDNNDFNWELTWMIFVAVIGSIWIVVTQIRVIKAQLLERNDLIISKLLSDDQLSIQHVDIHIYLARHAYEHKDYFRMKERLSDPEFIKAKTYVYSKLNLMDEIITMGRMPRWSIRRFWTASGIIEFENWKNYFKTLLCHPLYKSIMEHPEESSIFGDELGDFYKKNIEGKEGSADPFIW